MIDIRKLKELVRLMVSNDLVELDVRDEQEQVTIKRPNPQSVPMVMHPGPAAVSYPGAPTGAGAAAGGASAGAATLAPSAAASAASVPSEAGVVLESPMVGTFYLAAGPGKPNFVQIGSKVGPDTIVCLIEAMKIFNEIKAEQSGTIVAISAKNGSPVEFGQPLFRILPD